MQKDKAARNQTNFIGDNWLDWNQAYAAGAGVVGGKAWNLARLHRYGFDVPSGVVIPVSVYAQFIEHNRLRSQLNSVSAAVSLRNISDVAVTTQIQRLHKNISDGSFPREFMEYVQTRLAALKFLHSPLAVRSSATQEDGAKASFAGIHESYLNVSGVENILIAIKNCFASVWTLQAIVYRRKQGIQDTQVQPAVILMEMIDADAAGVAFTCDPATGREDVCLVNANFGLGESVVKGCVEPDTYYIEHCTYRTLEQRFGKKQTKTMATTEEDTREDTQQKAQHWVLSAEQQLRLGVIISRVFAALGDLEQHQDIEWVIADNKIYVVQARPVTALPRYTESGIESQADVWSNANFRDVVPMVIPYVQQDSMMRNINRTILAPFKDIGYAVIPGLAVAKYIGGRAYFNTHLYQWLLYDSCGMKPADLKLFMGGHQPDIAVPERSPYVGKNNWRRLVAVVKNLRLISRYQKQQEQFFAKVDRFVEHFDKIDLDALTDTEFLQLVDSSENEFLDFTDKYMALSGGIGPFALAIKQLQPVFADEAIGLVNALASGQGDMPSAEQGYQLLELAEVAREDLAARAYLSASDIDAHAWRNLPDHSPFKQKFQHYLELYGHRATNEIDCSQPRWREDPGYLLANIAKTLASADSAAHKRRQKKIYQQAQRRLGENVGFFKRRWVMNLIKQAVKGAQTREKAKSCTVKLNTVTRRVFLEAGRRLLNKGIIAGVEEVFYCAQAEVYAILKSYWDGRQLPTLIAERKRTMAALSNEKAPDIIIDNERIFKQAAPVKDANQYQGIGVSAGVVEGKAELIHSPQEGSRLKPGDILVAPSTDPSWTPLFVHAGGIVLETGGYTSHGSIVAREYGIPAVVNVAGVLQLVKNGQTVIVNGNNGTVVMN